jgi:acetyl-CoA acetyltransferase
VTAAIAGVGYTDLSKASGRSVLELAREACQAAVADAGLPLDAVDGIVSYSLLYDSVPCQAVATVLALPQLRLALDAELGGQAPCHLVGLAASMVETGRADHVLVFRAMNGRSGARVGTMAFPGLGAQYRYPIGYDAYLMYVAMWARRFLVETGQDEDDLGAVAVAQRAYATANERAYRREPLTLDQHRAEPYVVEPFRASDCTVEVDGACAVLVTSQERAVDLRHTPVVVAASAYRAGPRPGLDIGDHLLWED